MQILSIKNWKEEVIDNYREDDFRGTDENSDKN